LPFGCGKPSPTGENRSNERLTAARGPPGGLPLQPIVAVETQGKGPAAPAVFLFSRRGTE